MARTVRFGDKVVAEAAAVAPNFEFPRFAQVAVREKLDRLRREQLVTDQLLQNLKSVG